MTSESVQRLMEAGAAKGLEVVVEEFPDGTRTAADAAAAVGCKVDQIVKSMIFDADGEIVLALTSGAHQVDPEALATVAGVARCDRADPDQVRATTGYAIGGVAPLGHRTPVRTWIDPHLLTFDRIWAAAGTPRHVFAVDPDALMAATGAVAASFTTGS
ncbi:MAG: YbaK/EbsC family protein [Actinomycetota bacterium]